MTRKYFSNSFAPMQNESVSEFFKLDPIDKKTLFWLMDNKPEEIKSWIKYVSKHNVYVDKLRLDAEKLYQEIEIELG